MESSSISKGNPLLITMLTYLQILTRHEDGVSIVAGRGEQGVLGKRCDGGPIAGNRVVDFTGGLGPRSPTLTPDCEDSFLLRDDGQKSAGAVHRTQRQPFVRSRVVSGGGEEEKGVLWVN